MHSQFITHFHRNETPKNSKKENIHLTEVQNQTNPKAPVKKQALFN